jgi:hypothetical protein
MTQKEDKQSVDTHKFIFILCLVYTMWSVSLDCLSSYCVPYVVCVYGLFIFFLCIVYPVLSVSVDCFSSSCVMCTQCCGCLWIVYLLPASYVPSIVGVYGSQDEDKQSIDTDNIGYTISR